MDVLIYRLPFEQDADLRLCHHEGIAYQTDMTATVEYSDAYFERYAGYEGSAVAAALNAGRCAMLARHAPEGARVLDIGAGSGAFVRSARSWGFDAFGFDINPKTVEHLKAIDAFARDPATFDVLTFWDSLEHIAEPAQWLSMVKRNGRVLVALPIFSDLREIRQSKHYRPGEHLYYWTADGFVQWMRLYGYRLTEQSTHETDAGREAIGAFAFVRELPMPCHACGGETWADSWDWKNSRSWLCRCLACDGISQLAETREQAEALAIQLPELR